MTEFVMARVCYGPRCHEILLTILDLANALDDGEQQIDAILHEFSKAFDKVPTLPVSVCE